MPVRLRCTVETCLRAGVLPQDIAREVHVSHQWRYQLRQNLEAFDSVSPPPLSVQGRPRKIYQRHWTLELWEIY